MELTYLDEGGVAVTTTRLIVRGQVYAMNGIISLSTWKKDPDRSMPILIIIAGLYFLYSGLHNSDDLLVGAIFIIAGIVIYRRQKPIFTIRLTLASGNADVISSKDKNFISRIVTALNKAIIDRG